MQEKVTTKPWYKSWTVWFNTAAGVSVLADWMITEGFGFVENPIFAGVVAGINLALRFKTNRPVASETKSVFVDK